MSEPKNDKIFLHPGTQEVPIAEVPLLIAQAIEPYSKIGYSEFRRAEILKKHKEAIAESSLNGELVGRDQLSVGELARYASKYNITVEVLEPSINSGRYSLVDATETLAQATDESATKLLKILKDEVTNGLLPVYWPGQNIKRDSDVVRVYDDEAYWDDLNKWLEKSLPRLEWRFPSPNAQSVNNDNPDKDKAYLPDSHPLAFFRDMDKFHFGKITLKFNAARNSIIVSGYGVNQTVAFSDLGLTKGDNIAPNVLGSAFWEIARGDFDESDYKNKISNRRLTSLSKALRKAFDTKDKPFIKGVPRFTITNPSQALVEKEGRNRTVQYDDSTHAPDYQTPEKVYEKLADAEAYLKKHDENYNKASSNYYSPDDE